jgi:hypothetical protein
MIFSDAFVRFITCMCVITTACLLVASFTLHAVQVEHVHFGEHHDHAGSTDNNAGMSVYMHSAEKKMLILLVSLTVSWFILSRKATQERMIVCFSRAIDRARRHYFLPDRLYCYLAHALRIGLLNPKRF